jgi:uncharacterized protein YndB with AHSA1/START domain
MSPITGSVEISRPAQAVFDYVADLSKHTEWQTGLEKVVVETEGPTRVGTKAVDTRHVTGGPRDIPYEITECDAPRRLAFKVTGGPIRPEGSMTLTSLDNGTRTRVEFEMEFHGHGLGVVLLPIATRDARKHVPGDMAALKQQLESSS